VCNKISGVGPDPVFKYRRRVSSASVACSISPEEAHVRVYSLFGRDSVPIV
jgi:hypothetical protein